MKKKLLVCADTHLASSYPLSTSPHPYKDTFFRQAWGACRQIAQYASQNNCDILHAGDLFNDSKIDSPELHMAISFFQLIENEKLKMFLDLGNHEVGYEEGVPSVPWVLSTKFDSICCADYRRAWTRYNWNGLNIYLVPFKKEQIFNECLQQLLDSDIQQPAALCIHEDIKGIRMGSAKMQTGLAEEQICKIVSNYFKFIVCGHMHQSHYGDKFSIPLIIPGSTIAMDFRDEGKEKSFYVLEFDRDYGIDKVRTVKIQDQISFVSGTVEDAAKYSKKDLSKTYLRLSCELGNDEKEIRNQLSGIFGLQINWRKESTSPDLSANERPIEMKIDEWLPLWMKAKRYSDEEIDAAVIENEILFPKN